MAGGRKLALGAPGGGQQSFPQCHVLNDHELPGFVTERTRGQPSGFQYEVKILVRNLARRVKRLASMAEVKCIENVLLADHVSPVDDV